MCVCVCVCVCVCICIYICNMYVCMYVCIYTYIHIHICMYVCMYVCVYVCMYIACRGAAALLERRQAAGSQGELPSLFCPLPPCLLDFPPARRPASPRRLCVYLLASKLLLPPAIRHGRSSTGWWKPFPAPRPLRNRRARLMSNPARLPIAVKWCPDVRTSSPSSAVTSPPASHRVFLWFM